ncbi:hypothetical protein [Novosphingobium beihaiensis]|uniref:Uncharacterized protein n=1 Tax=Novosphingobium beihaiensis TaxID=2930389 RepID=A0ABT0BNM6_9SPHN|nr:hypothetical protein [Novosphingobium beihaiensis]MCJ2186649.1 hypothetical protein [Novosphingobium beihaiensis]
MSEHLAEGGLELAQFRALFLPDQFFPLQLGDTLFIGADGAIAGGIDYEIQQLCHF